MDTTPNLLQAAHFKTLLKHYQTELEHTHLKELLQNAERNAELIYRQNDIVLDLTHSKVKPSTVGILVQLAKELKVPEKIERMFAGDIINQTESRPVLHTALRANKDRQVYIKGGENVVPLVHQVLERVASFSDQVRSGKRLGYSGKPLTQIVTIGIGGSYLGVEFVYEAIRSHPKVREAAADRELHLIANVDPLDAAQKFEKLDHQRCLFIVLSKTFTTAETMLNAKTVRNWLIEKYAASVPTLDIKQIVSAQMCAVSTAIERTADFGIDSNNVFGFWNWVGGRYSVTSAIGAVPLSLVFGYKVFQSFLRGAQSMDKHFQSSPLEQNLPILLSLIGVFNTQVLNHGAMAILPYSQALKSFAKHVQQLSMESNGKRVTLNGTPTPFQTGQIIFGEPGTNGQHSFYQLLHQGRVVPAEFIGFTKAQTPLSVAGHAVSNHEELMANFFAQPDALAVGITAQQVREERKDVKESLVPHLVFPGDRPSLSLLFLGQLTPFNCGELLALYEHRVAVEGFVYNINSFDQMGVELGKVLAKKVRGVLGSASRKEQVQLKEFNSATGTLLGLYSQHCEKS